MATYQGMNLKECMNLIEEKEKELKILSKLFMEKSTDLKKFAETIKIIFAEDFVKSN